MKLTRKPSFDQFRELIDTAVLNGMEQDTDTREAIGRVSLRMIPWWKRYDRTARTVSADLVELSFLCALSKFDVDRPFAGAPGGLADLARVAGRLRVEQATARALLAELVPAVRAEAKLAEIQ